MELNEIIKRMKNNYYKIIEDREDKARLKAGLNEYQKLIQLLEEQPSSSDAEDTNNRIDTIYIKAQKIQELQKLVFELERKNKLVIDSILKSDFSEYAKNNLISENLQNFEDRIEFLTTEIDDRATEVMNLVIR